VKLQTKCNGGSETNILMSKQFKLTELEITKADSEMPSKTLAEIA
jgi:hypothetical protein